MTRERVFPYKAAFPDWLCNEILQNSKLQHPQFALPISSVFKYKYFSFVSRTNLLMINYAYVKVWDNYCNKASDGYL